MKTACILLVPGKDIPGTMYRVITATTSLALRVIFEITLYTEPAGMHAYTLRDVTLVSDIFSKLSDWLVHPLQNEKTTSIL